ncbi:MAG: PIG-L family deacetylase [Desulfobacterales bacterium]|nr:PIG-L family deacetylase [Desulfobacterales bacterium]
MLTEENLIPYHATDLTGKRVLVLAPHPDDETFGCGGALALHARSGDPVKVVFLTNGAKGDTSGRNDKEEYVKLRQNEALKACACLDVTDLEFWPYEDRSLAGSRGALRRMIDLLEDFRPQLVYAPSPLEFHPDHRAACFLLCDAIGSYRPDLDIAFYEVGQPLRVNLLVDITGALNSKVKAVSAYGSQLKERPYGDICMGLDRYRSLTLPEDVTHAEGFSLWGASLIRKIGPLSLPFQQVHRLAPAPGEAGPLVSVIVRTKDRPKLLANALRSIAEQSYANLEIVVVNDGGQDVKDVATALAGGIPVTYIAHEKSKGRSAAANSGLKAARGLYLNFLDDDDVFYPDHVETLVSAILSRDEKVVYSSVLSAHFSGPAENPENCIKKVVNHDIDFDADRILFQNYIPIMSALFHRDILSKVEGFSEDLTLFEDWDFWIRVSRHFHFHHIDKVTAEYRFYGAKTTEESHRQKYEYLKAQAQIFDRATPFLTGEIWTKFLSTDLFDQLRHDGKCQNDRLEPARTELRQTTDELNEAYRQIEELRGQVQADKALLEEIFSSKGWRWLSRLRRLKVALSFGNSGIS